MDPAVTSVNSSQGLTGVTPCGPWLEGKMHLGPGERLFSWRKRNQGCCESTLFLESALVASRVTSLLYSWPMFLAQGALLCSQWGVRLPQSSWPQLTLSWSREDEKSSQTTFKLIPSRDTHGMPRTRVEEHCGPCPEHLHTGRLKLKGPWNWHNRRRPWKAGVPWGRQATRRAALVSLKLAGCSSPASPGLSACRTKVNAPLQDVQEPSRQSLVPHAFPTPSTSQRSPAGGPFLQVQRLGISWLEWNFSFFCWEDNFKFPHCSLN